MDLLFDAAELKCFHNISHITNGIYISGLQPLQGYKCADNLLNLNIKTVISMTEYPVRNLAEICEENGINYYHFACEDIRGTPINKYFDDIFDIIYPQYAENYKVGKCGRQMAGVVVHCMEGKSRSVSVVMAFMIKLLHSQKQKQKYLPHILRFIKKSRSIAEPNQDFMQQLYNYELSLL